jgi:hypothetical protein
MKIVYDFHLEDTMHDQAFSRGQVQWALWKFATIDLPSGEEPASAFRARVQHLLLLDRSGRYQDPADPVQALSSDFPQGSGVDATFTAVDGFCLAIAMDLLRAGFKQAEVARLLAHLRQPLEGSFAKILERPPTLQSRPAGKTSAQGNRQSGDDRRVFLVIQQVEFSEAFPAFPHLSSNPSEVSIVREPVFCVGINELRDQLDKMDHFFRRAIVLEIAYTAVMIAALLEQAPAKRRGRPREHVEEPRTKRTDPSSV